VKALKTSHTGAQNAANVVTLAGTWQYTGEVIQEWNRLNVLFVANDLQRQVALWDTWESTRERDRTSVHCVTRVLVTPGACSDINIVCTATVDHMIVLPVGSCLRLTLNWSFMFVFRLMQSRTHVDTVQTVLHGTINSRHICWSHTMKVLGSRVTFVRRNSAAVVTSRYTFSDMKLWSRTFAVNVQSVSIQQLNWDIIIQYIQNTNSFSCGLCNRLFKRKRTVKIHFKKCSVEHGVTGVVL